MDATAGDWRSLLPPLIALLIALSQSALCLRFPAPYLGAAVTNGSFLTAMWIEVKAFLGGLLSLVGVNAIDGNAIWVVSFPDSFNLQILGFTLALVGLVLWLIAWVGLRLVNALSRFAKGPRSAQGVTCAMGTAIFFDDYANTVVVGTTARSLTDRHEPRKLAYIVDSTSATVAGIAIISTWIGYEVGLFDDLLGTLNGVPGMPSSGYELFFAILPFRFYCILAQFSSYSTQPQAVIMAPCTARRRDREAAGLLERLRQTHRAKTKTDSPAMTSRNGQ